MACSRRPHAAGDPREALGALQTALQDPKVIERFAELGTTPVLIEQATPAAMDAHLAAEITKWQPAGRRARRLQPAELAAPHVRCRGCGSPSGRHRRRPPPAPPGTHHRPRRRQGLGRHGEGGRGSLDRAADRPRRHPRPRPAPDRDRRGRASGPRRGRARRRRPHARDRAVRRSGRPRALPDLGRRLGAAGAAGRSIPSPTSRRSTPRCSRAAPTSPR